MLKIIELDSEVLAITTCRTLLQAYKHEFANLTNIQGHVPLANCNPSHPANVENRIFSISLRH